jgi:PAS domain S-box-containing protein
VSEAERSPFGTRNGLRPVAVLTNGRRRTREPYEPCGYGPVGPHGPSGVDRRRSRLLYDEGGYLLTRHDEKGTVGSASPAVELLLGRLPWQVEGRRWHDFVHPADASAFEAWWGSLGHGSSSTHAYRLCPRPEDGTVVWVQTLARVLVDDATGATEIHALTHDVSLAVERSEELSRERGQLEGRNDTLTRDNRALTRFAGDAAHDLRAPLQAITGFAQLLARREGTELDETSQRFLAMIMGAAGDMANLINAALEHGQATWVEAPLEPVDCTTIVERTLLHLDAEIARTGATVHVGDLPTVHAEPNQLSRVFQNLIANACKPGPGGRPTHVTVSSDRMEGAWQLSVSDDGVGVPPEDRERIFELFGRGRDAEGDGGAGIGLAICRTIVERHGGRIWVEDVPGGGSRFSFFIPDFDDAGTDPTF